MRKKQFCIYIMMNQKNTTSYIGVTSDLTRRVWQHKQKLVEGFTKKYNLTKLVYFEVFDDPASAIEREKQLKKWSREKKVWLIKQLNPKFRDLSEE
ncbi:MAG: GIY-YIG nuclease family protein [Patescibacteria group bacterium]|nr:GIY-YIG nuclease family protein [Patescibacteria group bacterium]